MQSLDVLIFDPVHSDGGMLDQIVLFIVLFILFDHVPPREPVSERRACPADVPEEMSASLLPWDFSMSLKRDMDLIRALILKLEAEATDRGFSFEAGEAETLKRTPDEVRYNLQQAEQMGLIEVGSNP